MEDIDELLVGLYPNDQYTPFDPIPLENYEGMMILDNGPSQTSVDALRPRQQELEQFPQAQVLTYQHHQHYNPPQGATNSYYMQTPVYNYSHVPESEMDSGDSLDYMDGSAVDSDYEPLYSSPSTVSSTETPPETPTTTPRAAKERKKGETVFLRPPAFAEEHVGMFGMINFRKPGAWTRQKSK